MNRFVFLPCLLLSTVSGIAHAADAPSFGSVGVPFLQKHCLACHNDKKARGEINLAGFKDEASILKERKLWSNVLKQIESGAMPPEEKPRPTPSEIDGILRSVKETFAKADRLAKPDPGRVTVRRLNKTEYNNTIRDLIGIDFNPAEDFPADDIGHGFDNIGDVLSISPVLMERYLAAAESIMQRAIFVDPPKPVQRWMGSQYLEPAGANVPKVGKFRPITNTGKSPIETGPLHTPYQVPRDGEYIFRVRVYGQADGPPLEVVLLAWGNNLSGATPAQVAQTIDHLDGSRPFRILHTATVTATEPNKAQTIEVKIPPEVGFERLAVGMKKRPAGKDATLFVEYMYLEGPLDTRPALQRKLLNIDPKQPRDPQTRSILQRFADRAYRRPATAVEVDRLVKIVKAAEARGEKWEAGMQLAMQAVLCSPKFLFRLELDDRPQSKEPVPLDDFALASRLSYFLWSSMPDDRLFELARTKKLTANLESEVRRMLADPKSDAFVSNFALQWLQLRRLSTFAPDPTLFPRFDEPLRQAMLKETELFFAAILRENRSILDLIDGKFTFLNERLSWHYGIQDTNGNRSGVKIDKPGQPIKGDQFVRVNLEKDTQRGGLLTQASILTVTSNPTRTSPVKRGRWVLEQLLGTPPPPPPPNVPELEEAKGMLKGTLRQRMEQHRSNAACASCHARMDPLGFAFENYDAIGAYRWRDGDAAIDASGVLPGGEKFRGPTELKQILRAKQDLFARNLAEKLLIYAIGRGVEPYDQRTIDTVVAAAAKDGWKLSRMIIEIVRSDPFRLRRGSAE